jgi:hypothetical protein
MKMKWTLFFVSTCLDPADPSCAPVRRPSIVLFPIRGYAGGATLRA